MLDTQKRDRNTERQRDREIERQKYRETERQRDREMEIDRFINSKRESRRMGGIGSK